MGSFVVVLSKSGPAAPDVARNMLAAAPHRGTCFEVGVLGSCVVGVANRSEMHDSSIATRDGFIAAFNGRIDNGADVCALVTKLGFPPSCKSAADLVISAFRAFGTEAPNRLRGSFAGVVSDGNTLWCFRDHLGYRCVFYRDEPRTFFAASEAKQVLAGAGITKEPNLDVLELILYSRATPSMPSALKGIDRLAKASFMKVTRERVGSAQRYWRPEGVVETSRLKADEIPDAFYDVFGKSIERTLTGKDVIALSGGIDSPAVAAFAAPLQRKLRGIPISSLSTVYPDHPKVDERTYIEMIVKYLDIDAHFFAPDAGPWDNVAKWCALFDGPVNTLSFPEVSDFYQKARSLGFRNVYTGDIAEVTFNLNNHLFGHLLTHGRWKPLLQLIRKLRGRSTSVRELAAMAVYPLVPGSILNRYLHARGFDFPERIPAWMDRAKAEEEVFRKDLVPRGRDRWTMVQLRPFIEGASTTLEPDDICAEIWDVTVQRPFGDVDVCEFFLSLPAELKFEDTRSKTLMRRMLRGKLPDAILDRRDKTVFSTYILSHLDYDAAKRYLVNPDVRMKGINYEALAEKIERRDFSVIDYSWANDLIRVHAFLSLWTASP